MTTLLFLLLTAASAIVAYQAGFALGNRFMNTER